ncbi:MAG: hypothetical protein Q8N51_03730 [Gammaproteobacteria bacterium]|nr:hypothetical protein [Gammaproteobacteria bacterium]
MRGIGRIVGVMIATLCLLYGAEPAAAATKVKRIWPREFLDLDVSQSSFRSPESIGNVFGSSAEFHAPLILPLGSRITKVVSWSNGTGQSSRNGWVMRYGPGVTGNFVATGNDNSVNPALEPNGKEWTLYSTPDGIGNIQKGFRYDVHLYINGTDARVWAVDVTYSTR